MTRIILLLLLSGCAFEYHIPDYYDWEAVDTLPVCKGTLTHWEWDNGYRHYTTSVPCAKHLGFTAPTDYTQ